MCKNHQMSKVKSERTKKKGQPSRKDSSVSSTSGATDSTARKGTARTVTFDIVPESDTTRRTRKNSQSTFDKISRKSKPIISKRNKKVSDITWLKGLLQHDITTDRIKMRSEAGIEVRYPKSLSLRIEDGIEYVTYPWNNGKCGGYVKISPGKQKAPKRTGSTMSFLVLVGKISFLSGNDSKEYSSGTVFTIPKGVLYGLHNKSRRTCFLRFQAIKNDQ